jgi:hypothetical protein
MESILRTSALLKKYMILFPDVDEAMVISRIMEVLRAAHDKNTLGVRLINTLLNKYFINGGDLSEKEVKKTTFQRKLSFKEEDMALEAL